MLPAALSASLSFLSNGLEMYYYANVNFDTEFKKRLLDFFSFFKKKVPYVVIIASLFCNVNCNYAFCKRGGGEGRKGKEVALHLVLWFLCPWYPMSWRGRGVRARSGKGLRSEVQRPLGPPVVAGRPGSPAKPVWDRILHPSRAVLTQGSRGALEAPVFSGKKYSSFSEFRTLSSSGNHVSLVLTLKFILHQLQKPPPLPPPSCSFLIFCSS